MICSRTGPSCSDTPCVSINAPRVASDPGPCWLAAAGAAGASAAADATAASGGNPISFAIHSASASTSLASTVSTGVCAYITGTWTVRTASAFHLSGRLIPPSRTTGPVPGSPTVPRGCSPGLGAPRSTIRRSGGSVSSKRSSPRLPYSDCVTHARVTLPVAPRPELRRTTSASASAAARPAAATPLTRVPPSASPRSRNVMLSSSRMPSFSTSARDSAPTSIQRSSMVLMRASAAGSCRALRWDDGVAVIPGTRTPVAVRT